MLKYQVKGELKVENQVIKKPWVSPQIIELDIRKTENGGGFGWFDIAFQDTGEDDYELLGS